MQNSTKENKGMDFKILAAIVGTIWACVLVVVALFIVIYFRMVPTTVGLGPITFAQPTQTPLIIESIPSLAPTPFQTQILPANASPTIEIQPTVIIGETPFVPTPAMPNPNNLVINGSFTDGFNGWTREVLDQGGSSKVHIIPFASGDFGSALKLENQGKGGVYFSQDVLIPSVDVDFYATFTSKAEAGLLGGNSQSDIWLVYSDGQGNELGKTVISNLPGTAFTDTPLIGAPQTPKDTNQVHYFYMKNDTLIKDYKINIKQEIDENLLGIQSSQVVKIQIIVATGTSSSFYSELIVTDIMLLPH